MARRQKNMPWAKISMFLLEQCGNTENVFAGGKK